MGMDIEDNGILWYNIKLSKTSEKTDPGAFPFGEVRKALNIKEMQK